MHAFNISLYLSQNKPPKNSVYNGIYVSRFAAVARPMHFGLIRSLGDHHKRQSAVTGHTGMIGHGAPIGVIGSPRTMHMKIRRTPSPLKNWRHLRRLLTRASQERANNEHLGRNVHGPVANA